jgi:hypothetical protein
MPTLGMGNEHQLPFYCIADRYLAVLIRGMVGIRVRYRKRVKEHRTRILEVYVMLS